MTSRTILTLYFATIVSNRQRFSSAMSATVEVIYAPNAKTNVTEPIHQAVFGRMISFGSRNVVVDYALFVQTNMTVASIGELSAENDCRWYTRFVNSVNV